MADDKKLKQDGHYPTQVPIDYYGNGGFRFAGMSHKGSMLCLPSGMHAWDIRTQKDIKKSVFAPVLAQANDIEVLLIGQGEEIAFLTPDLREMFKEYSIIVEAVATGSAISTYNILLGENRAVAAALIAVEEARRAK